MSVQLLLNFLIFFSVIGVFIYPLGDFTASWISKGHLSKSSSVALGLFITTLEAYFLGLVHLYFLAIPLVIFQSLVIGMHLFYKHRPVQLFRFSKVPLAGLIFIVISVFINSLMLFPFGQVTPGGISLYGAHYVDSTWHLSLINSLTKSVPPENPLYGGTQVTNYHYLVDLQIALIHNLTRIPIPDLYFQIIGPFYLLILSILIYEFASNLTGKPLGGVIALSFVMLSSNWYYWVAPVYPHASINPSVAWVDFYSTKAVNYPLTVSLILLFVILDVIRRERKISVSRALVLGLISGCLFGVKSHTALVLVGALGLLALINLARKNFSWLLVFLVSLVTVFVFSRAVITSKNGGLEFKPLWFIQVMYESSDHLNYPQWELRRQTLLATRSLLGLSKLYLQGISWFLFINLGALVIGFVSLLDKKLDRNLKTVFLGLFLCGLLPTLLYIYTSTAIVTIQFVYLSVVAASVLTAYLLTRMSGLKATLSFVLIWATLIPGVTFLTSQYISWSKSYSVSADQASAAVFLSRQPPGVIFTDQTFSAGSYVSGYSDHPVFLGDRQILSSLGINYSSREDQTRSLSSCASLPGVVKYVLVTAPTLKNCSPPIFSSKSVYVYLSSNSPQSKLP